MTTPELLPCPFCGSDETRLNETYSHWVSCDRCQSEGPGEDTQPEAIAAWNRRAGQSANAERVAVLEKALRDLCSYGCPACSGDCGSANPPTINCPMQRARAALGDAS
jgi:Lar family restriction alleviation protein